MKHILATVILTTALLPSVAAACSCASPGSVEEEKAQSSRVFVGHVVSVENRTPRMDKGWLTSTIDWVRELFGAKPPYSITNYPYRHVTFAVSESFKGASSEKLQVSTGMGGGDCGYIFEKGEDYVVYADGKDSSLVTGICSLTGPTSDVRAGLRVLRNGS